MTHLVTSQIADLPRLRTPALFNAAEYWLAPERFVRRCEQLGDRFLVPMPASQPWLCLTNPDDIKIVFAADTGVLRLGAALAKNAPHPLVLGPTGLTNVDGDEHTRRRKMQLPPFRGRALANYEDIMQRKTEDALGRWPYGTPVRADSHMQVISMEVIIAVIFGVTDPDRVQRLRAATLALIREGNSRRFFLQTMIVTARNKGWEGPFPRMRAAMAAVDAIVLEETAERRRNDDLDQEDVLGMFLRARDENGNPMPAERDLRRYAHTAGRRTRDNGFHPRLDP